MGSDAGYSGPKKEVRRKRLHRSHGTVLAQLDRQRPHRKGGGEGNGREARGRRGERKKKDHQIRLLKKGKGMASSALISNQLGEPAKGKGKGGKPKFGSSLKEEEGKRGIEETGNETRTV